jgi:hypothetical protein
MSCTACASPCMCRRCRGARIAECTIAGLDCDPATAEMRPRTGTCGDHIVGRCGTHRACLGFTSIGCQSSADSRRPCRPMGRRGQHMQRRQLRIILFLGLSLGALQCVAAAVEAASRDDARAISALAATMAADGAQTQSPPAKASSSPAAVTAGNDAGVAAAKKSRLRFRTADGTCGCTCASGGTSEADIRKAEAARAIPAR